MNRTEIILSYPQAHFLVSNKKFSCFTGGYKAGKTFIGARKSVKTLLETKKTGLIATPNYRMNKDLINPEIEETLTQHGIKYNYRAGDSIYETKYGNILLRTLDKRNSLEGHKVAWFWLDEADLLTAEKMNENWNVLISKLIIGDYQRGFCTGTNEGFEFMFEKFYKEALPDPEIKKSYCKDNEHQIYISPTICNMKNLPKDYIKLMKKNYSPKLFNRYMNGEFVNIQEGQVYYDFSRQKNLGKVELKKNYPLCITYDFNVNPMTMTVFQYYNEKIYVYDVFTLENCNTRIATQTFCKKYAGLFQEIEYYGDATGKKTDTKGDVGESDWDIIDNELEKHFDIVSNCVPTCNPARKDRWNTMNSRFYHKQIIINDNNENCKPLIQDLEQITHKDIKTKNPKRGHWTDNLGYAVYEIMPIGKIEIDYNKNNIIVA